MKYIKKYKIFENEEYYGVYFNDMTREEILEFFVNYCIRFDIVLLYGYTIENNLTTENLVVLPNDDIFKNIANDILIFRKKHDGSFLLSWISRSDEWGEVYHARFSVNAGVNVLKLDWVFNKLKEFYEWPTDDMSLWIDYINKLPETEDKINTLEYLERSGMLKPQIKKEFSNLLRGMKSGLWNLETESVYGDSQNAISECIFCGTKKLSLNDLNNNTFKYANDLFIENFNNIIGKRPTEIMKLEWIPTIIECPEIKETIEKVYQRLLKNPINYLNYFKYLEDGCVYFNGVKYEVTNPIYECHWLSDDIITWLLQIDDDTKEFYYDLTDGPKYKALLDKIFISAEKNVDKWFLNKKNFEMLPTTIQDRMEYLTRSEKTGMWNLKK